MYRINELIKKFEKNNIDALLVTKPEDVFYLTSFYAEKIALVVNPKKCFFIIDFVYAEAAAKHIRGFNLLLTDGNLAKTIAGGLDRYKIKRAGFDSLSLPFALHRDIKRILKRKRFVPTESLVGSLRQIKDGREIVALKKVLKITKKSFYEIKKRLNPGLTELSVSNYIKELFIKNGADNPSFKPIVATQPGASEPHHAVTRKKLGNNKTVLVDMGAKLKGYNSDLTRMCPLGKISSKFVKLYNIILDAQKKAMDSIRPGVKISYIDSIARQHIVDKGLGKFFGHGLGHGIGLETHERPYITAKNKGALKEGMVFTVEPGIYIPGYGGLRVEDTVRVHKNGYEALTGDINKSI